jgi:hypothetical protein
MKRTDIKIGGVYAISDQRDATIGSTYWSFRPAVVREKDVHRDENIHGNEPQRTDGVRVELLSLDDLSPTGEFEVVRTREVKGDWQQHVTLLAANKERAEREAEQSQVERITAQEVAQAETGGMLSQDQAVQVTPEALTRARDLPVEVVGQGLLKVSGVRQDAIVLVLDQTTWLQLMETQLVRGSYALRIPQVQVVNGPSDISYVLAAALFAHHLREVVILPEHNNDDETEMLEPQQRRFPAFLGR